METFLFLSEQNQKDGAEVSLLGCTVSVFVVLGSCKEEESISLTSVTTRRKYNIYTYIHIQIHIYKKYSN